MTFFDPHEHERFPYLRRRLEPDADMIPGHQQFIRLELSAQYTTTGLGISLRIRITKHRATVRCLNLPARAVPNSEHEPPRPSTVFACNCAMAGQTCGNTAGQLLELFTRALNMRYGAPSTIKA